jgi:hypothetical protein
LSLVRRSSQKAKPRKNNAACVSLSSKSNLSKNDEDRDPHTLMGRTENTPDQNPGRRSYHHQSETPALSVDRRVPVAGERHIGRANRACQRRCDRKTEIPANQGNRRLSPGRRQTSGLSVPPGYRNGTCVPKPLPAKFSGLIPD